MSLTRGGGCNIELYVSMPEYHGVLTAIAADWSKAPYLADWFEDHDMVQHADFFREITTKPEVYHGFGRYKNAYYIPIKQDTLEWYQRQLYLSLVYQNKRLRWRGRIMFIHYGPNAFYDKLDVTLATYKLLPGDTDATADQDQAADVRPTRRWPTR